MHNAESRKPPVDGGRLSQNSNFTDNEIYDNGIRLPRQSLAPRRPSILTSPGCGSNLLPLFAKHLGLLHFGPRRFTVAWARRMS
jgi:hypothetical protein